MKKYLTLFMAVVLLLATVVGCAAPAAAPTPAPVATEAPAAPEPTAAPAEPAQPAYDHLTVYTAFPDEELPTYFNAFEKDTGIKVDYVRLSAGEMLARVTAEKDNPQASLMYGGSSDTYIAAMKEGLLEAYQSPELANVPAEYHDAQGVWNPVYVGAICFACNKDWFTEKGLPYPASWEDLLKPEFKGQVSMAHPTTSGTSYTVLATIMQLMGEEKGWAYFDKLNANVRQYTKAGAAPPQQVALGEAAIAITFSHDGLKPAREGYPIELSFPSDGTGFEVGAVALIKGGPAKEVENAKKFIDWSMSKRGQELYIDSESNRMPVNSTAAVTEGLIDLSTLAIIDYDAVWAGENKKALQAEFIEKVDKAENLLQ